MQGLSKKDEYLHEHGDRKDWRESFYFNWVDLKSGISGFSTIGLLPNASKREFVLALFYDDKREVHYSEPDGTVSEEIDAALSDGVLSYGLVRPLKQWTLSYRGKALEADVKWTGRFPVFDFGSGSGTSWAGHFEQSGKVSGELRFPDGRTMSFRGLGERDKSWGARDWHIESWYALHAQFDDLSIGLRRDVVHGEVHSSGGITTSDGQVAISRIDLETEFVDKPMRMPLRAVTKVYGADGSQYTLKSTLISSNSFTRFARQFPGGTTELFEEMATHSCAETRKQGTGLIEWLFTHPS